MPQKKKKHKKAGNERNPQPPNATPADAKMTAKTKQERKKKTK